MEENQLCRAHKGNWGEGEADDPESWEGMFESIAMLTVICLFDS